MLLNGPVSAGPWVQDKNSIYSRLAYAAEDHDGFTAKRGDFYLEWGASERWTLSGKYERVDFDTSEVFDSDGWRISARRRLLQKHGFVASGEFGILEGAALGGFRGCEKQGVELGAGLGWSGETSIGSIHTGGMVSRREHDGGCYHDRFEGIIGFTGKDNWTRTFQIWSERGEEDRSDKIEFMLSRQFGRFEPGFGLRREVSGEFEESAMVVSLAFRP